jgi:hypothetical protein
MHFINLQVTGEIWRQSNLAKSLQCYYFIDPTAVAPMSTAVTGYLLPFNISFPTVAGDTGGVAVDGAVPGNQINLNVTNVGILSWPPGAALWLVWEMSSAAGKSQGLAIDNFSFAATALGTPTNTPALGIQGANTGQLVLAWPSPATGYQLFVSTNLTPPGAWSLVTNTPVSSNGTFYLTIPTTNGMAQFFRLAGN